MYNNNNRTMSLGDDKAKHILLACTGSVATIKLPLLIEKLYDKAKALNILIHVCIYIFKYM